MRKIACLGFADITRWNAPIDDPTWEIWGLGWDPKLQRVNRLFEPHREDFWRSLPGRLSFYKRCKIDLYMKDSHEDIPASRKYPLKEVWENVFPWVRNLGTWDDPKPEEAVFESSMAYMLALAIYEKADRVGFWGVDMSVGTGYYYERPNMEALIAIARSRGIKVYVPKEAQLLKSAWESGIYGNIDPHHPELFWELNSSRESVKKFLKEAGEWHEEAA